MSREEQLDLRVELYRISGVDMTGIDGIGLQTGAKSLLRDRYQCQPPLA
jgi:hypothetical protein